MMCALRYLTLCCLTLFFRWCFEEETDKKIIVILRSDCENSQLRFIAKISENLERRESSRKLRIENYLIDIR